MRGIIGLGMVLLLVMVGCSRKVTSSITSKVTDSTTTREVPRIIPVSVPGKNVSVTMLVKCDSNTNQPIPTEVNATEESAFVNLFLDEEGVLTANGGCDSLKTEIETRDKIIERFRK